MGNSFGESGDRDLFTGINEAFTDIGRSITRDISRIASESIGEISGANKARKARMESEDAITREGERREIDLANVRERKRKQTIEASQAAGVARGAEAAKQSNALGSAEADISKDFLGL